MAKGVTSLPFYRSYEKLAEIRKTWPNTLICDPSIPKCNITCNTYNFIYAIEMRTRQHFSMSHASTIVAALS